MSTVTAEEHVSTTADIERMPLEQLEHEITQLAGHINAATCRWLLLVAELDRRESYLDWGCRSCAQWLSVQCGIATRTGREQVRVARALADLPLIRASFGRGELSYSQVRAMTRVGTEEIEETLLMYARHSTGGQLESLCRSYRSVLSESLVATNDSHRQRYLSTFHEEDGSLVINARIAAEEGALVLAALDAAREHLRAEGGSAEPSPSGGTEEESGYDPPSVTNADALVVLAETALESGCARVGPGGRELVVHVDVAALANNEDGCCHVEDGPAVHPETARRLACDSSVTRILERDGRPLSVARKTRSVPPALARALRSRDGGCQFPGCTERRFVDAHHIVHWAKGGETKLSNLVHLCRHHHRLVHEGGFGLAKEASGLVFRRPDGRAIPRVRRPRRGTRLELERRNREHGVAVDPRTTVPRWLGERLDKPAAVDGLASPDSRLHERRE